MLGNKRRASCLLLPGPADDSREISSVFPVTFKSNHPSDSIMLY
jgi:hypothetical protein